MNVKYDKVPERIEWIDTAKVMAMLLVIIGHCNYYRISTPFGGVYYFENGEEVTFVYEAFRWLTSFIYSFHMPLFMAISGMCFSLTVKKPISFIGLMKSKAQRLLIPLLRQNSRRKIIVSCHK